MEIGSINELISLMPLMADKTARTENYREIISKYYNITTSAYRSLWGESLHMSIVKGGETLTEAAANMERWLADQGGFRQGQKILDVGCGVGGPAFTIAAHSGAEITGITISPEQVAIARAKAQDQELAKSVTFVEGDFMHMPFEDESFDAAYAFEATCHMPDKAAGYREVARVLKPGGVFTGFDCFYLDGLTDDEYNEYIEPICMIFATPNLITLPRLTSCLEEAGFEGCEVRNANEFGSFDRMWEIVKTETVPAAAAKGDPFLAGIMSQCVQVTTRASQKGYFMIGYWRCTKKR